MGLLLAGHGTLHAGGQPCAAPEQNAAAPGQNAGAAPGQQYGTEADVAEKKQLDTQKYETAGANSATEGCQDQLTPVKDAPPDK